MVARVILHGNLNEKHDENGCFLLLSEIFSPDFVRKSRRKEKMFLVVEVFDDFRRSSFILRNFLRGFKFSSKRSSKPFPINVLLKIELNVLVKKEHAK